MSVCKIGGAREELGLHVLRNPNQIVLLMKVLVTLPAQDPPRKTLDGILPAEHDWRAYFAGAAWTSSSKRHVPTVQGTYFEPKRAVPTQREACKQDHHLQE